MSDKLYDFLAKLGRTILPALAAFYGSLAEIWPLPYPDKIPQTIMVCVVLLNSWLGQSSADYYRKLAASVSEAEGVDPEAVEHHTEEDLDDSIE